MRLSLLIAILAGLALTTAPAQVYQEGFNFPNGSLIPGWKADVGAWKIANRRLYGTSSGWRYISRLGFSATNCVVQGEFFFKTSGVQFGGLNARFVSSSKTIMCKIQNNGGAPDFDRVFIYEKPGGSTYADIPGGTLSAICRMVLLDNQVWMQIDANKDGIFEQLVGPHTCKSTLGAGAIGMNSYGSSEMDNFKFFDAVLWGKTAAAPKIGTTYNMVLRTPAASTVPKPYFCMASLSNKGISLGSIAIPLGIDPLLEMSLKAPTIFAKFTGLLDKNGAAQPSIIIPNDPVLKNVSIFVAGLTMDPKKPYGIGHISNDLRIKFQ